MAPSPPCLSPSPRCSWVFLHEKAYQVRDTAIESSVVTKVKGFGRYANRVMDVSDYVTPPQVRHPHTWEGGSRGLGGNELPTPEPGPGVDKTLGPPHLPPPAPASGCTDGTSVLCSSVVPATLLGHPMHGGGVFLSRHWASLLLPQGHLCLRHHHQDDCHREPDAGLLPRGVSGRGGRWLVGARPLPASILRLHCGKAWG